jgi:maltose alpha-D-glucosyltransferase/alpha-amylase
MVERWYRNGLIYSLDVCLFQDSNGDGTGDIPGLVSRLDYLSRLGVTAIWVSPFHPSPRRDGGYDITDYYGVDQRLGSLGDFAELLAEADERGLRVMIDLVFNHTSDQHPWFRSARADPDSPYRDWYVWSTDEPADRWGGPVFPGAEKGIWTWDEQAEAWYRHRFYRFQPDLNTDHPAVRAELHKIMAFWLRLGVAGFRIDAAPMLIESRSRRRRDYALLHDIRETVSWQRQDAVLLAEANVDRDELIEYFGAADGRASRAMMVFAFRLNQSMMLALARQDARPIATALADLPDLPGHGQWATFLRNHDEVDLSGLADDERRDVFAAFGPEPEMQAYGRGIRRRLACMLGGDRRRLELAYSLQLSMPGTPVIRYGDEIGMGEDLSLREREAIRTPMQWTDTANAGFSRAAAEQLIAPVISDGPSGHKHVNVLSQRRDPNSLLTWFERMLHTRRECEEIGVGEHKVIDTGVPHVLVHTAHGPHGAILFAHNLSPEPCNVSIPPLPGERHRPLTLASDMGYDDDDVDLLSLDLTGYGYRWLRLNHTPWD